uniref:Uncharacterized protein n=1 Tax=Anguilla anguilla TaxID=7936 RepID=A0A0E9X1X1_ANGAN
MYHKWKLKYLPKREGIQMPYSSQRSSFFLPSRGYGIHSMNASLLTFRPIHFGKQSGSSTLYLHIKVQGSSLQ